MLEIYEKYYADNLEKYGCCSCGREFIVGQETLKRSAKEKLFCPFCSADITEWLSSTTDEHLEELKNGEFELGCGWLYVDDSEDDKEVLYDEKCIEEVC